MSTTTRFLLLTTLVATAGCTVKETPTTPLAGPSELAQRIALQITPDSILQDGASQAVLSIEASGADGRPTRGLAMRVEVFYEGVRQDYGTLSGKTVVSGEDGRARVTYTSPPRPATTTDDVSTVTFSVTPVGSDYTAAVARTVELRLVTPGVIQPPNSAPSADFTFSPTAPQALVPVVFDASTSTDGTNGDGDALRCGASCTYSWDFGDGSSGTGVFATHPFQRSGTYAVKLTVTDNRGAANTITKAVVVGTSPAPTARFTFSPTTPTAGQAIFFNASQSTASAGRQLVSYEWDFGSGRTGSGVTTSKTYDTPGTYQVTLTVTDDAGQSHVVVAPVSVSMQLQARLTATPTTGTTATSFLFDARGSTPGPGTFITSYRFAFGDGTFLDSALPAANHTYPAPGRYTVTVTIRDNQATPATSTATVVITVNNP